MMITWAKKNLSAVPNPQSNSSIFLKDVTDLENINIAGNFVESDADADTDTDEDLTILTIDNLKKSTVTLGNYVETADASKRTKNIQIIGNDLDNSITGGIKNDTLDGAAGDDTLTGGKGKDVFIYNSGRDIITDYAEEDKIRINDFSYYEEVTVEDTDVIFDYDDNNLLTIKGGADKAININSDVNYYTTAGIINGKKKAITFSADIEDIFDASKDKNYSKLVTINSAEVNNDLKLIGNKKANLLIAGKSNTTLNDGKGKDTLVGGEGEDVFIYENKSGNKIISDYNFEDDDFIRLGKGAIISKVTIKKDDVILKVGSNTITIENATQFNFTENGSKDVKTYRDSKLISGDSVTLDSSFKGTFDLNDYTTYNNVSAELGKKAVTLIGDEGDNILTGGKGKDSIHGGDNDDSLNGGKGNDSLWGDDGADTFVYYACTGNDTIMDYNYEDGDLLQILDKNGGEIASDKAIKSSKFDGEDLILSIKGGGKLILEGVDKSATVKFSNGGEQSF